MSYSPRPVYLNVFPRASGGGGGVLIPPSIPKANCVARPAKVIPDFCRLDLRPPQSPVSVERVQKSSSELPTGPPVPSPGEKPYPIASLIELGVSICCIIGCARTCRDDAHTIETSIKYRRDNPMFVRIRSLTDPWNEFWSEKIFHFTDPSVHLEKGLRQRSRDGIASGAKRSIICISVTTHTSYEDFGRWQDPVRQKLRHDLVLSQHSKSMKSQKSIFARTPATNEVSARCLYGSITCRSGVIWNH